MLSAQLWKHRWGFDGPGLIIISHDRPMSGRSPLGTWIQPWDEPVIILLTRTPFLLIRGL